MRAFNVLIALLLTGLMAACASTTVTKTGSRDYPAKSKDCALKVLTAFPQSPTKYEEIGLIHGKAGGSAFSGQDIDSLLPDMKKESCKIGADALIIRGAADSSYTEMYATGKRGSADATAIKILEN